MEEIAVLIPCYNEEKTIGKVVRDFQRELPEARIYVYDNNSTDETAAIAEKAGAVVRYEYRQGKGAVLRRMFREIEAKCYLVVDGDDTYPAGYAGEMTELVLEKGIDMVIGNRLSGTYFTENKRPLHGLGNRMVRFLVNLLFRSEIGDVMTGYRALGRTFVKSFPVLSDGFEIETEMTIHALEKNFLIREISISYRDRAPGSISKLHTLADGRRVLLMLWSMFREYRPKAYGGIWTVICEGVGTFLVLHHKRRKVKEEGYTETGIGIAAMMLTGVMLHCSCMVLEGINKKHRQTYELYLNLKRREDER